jgi:hypothetical protein
VVEIILENQFHNLGLLLALIIFLYHDIFILFRSWDRAPIFWAVVERTFKALETFDLVTGQGFVDQGVKLLLLPSVTIVAGI